MYDPPSPDNWHNTHSWVPDYKRAYEDGYFAAANGKPQNDNPFTPSGHERETTHNDELNYWWYSGWNACEVKDQKQEDCGMAGQQNKSFSALLASLPVQDIVWGPDPDYLPPPALPFELREARILYRNHKGEVAWRRVEIYSAYWGESRWHKGKQYLLGVFDLDKRETRIFAMADILDWAFPEEGKG